MEILFPFIMGLLVSLIISSTLRQSAQRHRIPVDPQARIGIMEYSPSIKMAAFLIPGFVLALLIYTFSRPHVLASDDKLWLLGLILAGVVAATLLGLEVIEKKVRLDDQGILWEGIFHTRICLWEEIYEVRFCRWRQMLIIDTVNGSRLTINPSLSGQDLLEALLWEKVAADKFRHAIYQLNRMS